MEALAWAHNLPTAYYVHSAAAARELLRASPHVCPQYKIINLRHLSYIIGARFLTDTGVIPLVAFIGKSESNRQDE